MAKNNKTNYKRERNFRTETVKKQRPERAVVKIDGITIGLPKRLATHNRVLFYAGGSGTVDRYTFSKIYNSGKNGEKIAVVMLKSLEPEHAKELARDVDDINVITEGDIALGENEKASKLQRNFDLEFLQERKEIRNEQRDEFMPEGGVIDNVRTNEDKRV